MGFLGVVTIRPLIVTKTLRPPHSASCTNVATYMMYNPHRNIDNRGDGIADMCGRGIKFPTQLVTRRRESIGELLGGGDRTEFYFSSARY